jgi:1-acyl-sn-glycerol-3-phosphate acyltransferase
LLYWICRFLIRTFATILFRWRIVGVDNLPAEGGVIFAANHSSLIDPLLVGSAVKRQVHYMAKDELFRTRFGAAFLRGLGAFPVRRGEADRQSLRESLRILGAGGVLGIFPEGTRSADGQFGKAQSGIAFLAKRSGAPVVPAAIVGSRKILRKGSILPHLARVEIRIGKPIHLSADEALSEKDQLRAAAERVMQAIAELAGE